LHLVIGHGPRSFVAYEAFIYMFAWQLMCFDYCDEASGVAMAWLSHPEIFNFRM
jgi:hypothetical protein